MDDTMLAVGDLGQSLRWETDRLMREAEGNRARAMELGLRKYVELGLINESDHDALVRVHRLGAEAGDGATPPERAYVETRRIHHEMLMSPDTTRMALAMVSAAAESYLGIHGGYGDDEPTVVFSKKKDSWADVGGLVGGVIGFFEGGLAGAYVGYKVGRQVGGKIDDHGDDDSGNGDNGGGPA